MQIPFVSPAYSARSTNIAAEACVNLYLRAIPVPGAKAKMVLLGVPGKRLLATLSGSGGIRGAYRPSFGNAIVVRGQFVYRVDSSWNAYLIGSLLTSSGPVSITDNGTDAVIVDGPYGYTVNIRSSAFARITDPDFYGSDRIVNIDSYLIANRPETQQFYISGLGDTSFDALDFASDEGAPDNIVSHVADHRELWLFGSGSTSVYRDTGDADFPFQRLDGSFMEVGCIAKHSPAKMDNTVYWIGGDERGAGIVYKAANYNPIRISTHALEEEIQGYADISDAEGFTYQQEGHSFYVLNFPTANVTWVYDEGSSAVTGMPCWHQRAYLDSQGRLNRDRASCHMYFGGQHVVGDWENGNLYALDPEYYSDNGDPLPAIRASGHIAHADYLWQFFDSLQVDMETGVGIQSGQGSNPVVSLDWSDDGGHTWSNAHSMELGKVGKYLTRARKTRLGRSRDRVFRITIADPVKRVILGASAQMKLGAS